MAYRALVNGREGVGVPPDDPGLTRGWSIFETFRTYGCTFFRLEAHLQRLAASAERLGVAMPDEGVLRSEIAQVSGADVQVRVTLTGANRIVLAKAVDQRCVGRPLWVASVVMEPTPWLPGSVKHGSRASWMMAAREKGVEEVIFLDRGGFVLEANRSNVFAVLDGVLHTPVADGRILAGVTRGAMIDAAKACGLVVVEAPLPIDAPFDELYVSSTLKELAPVAELDGRVLTPEVGVVGRRLHEAFRALTAQECNAGV